MTQLSSTNIVKNRSLLTKKKSLPIPLKKILMLKKSAALHSYIK